MAAASAAEAVDEMVSTMAALLIDPARGE